MFNPKVVNNLVLRGPQPLTIDDMELLKIKGVKTIISLESGLWDLFNNQINSEFYLAEQVDINVVHIKLHPILPPTLEQTKAILELICRESESGLVYVHCHHGVDRTGWVIAAYQYLILGHSLEEVKQGMLDNGFHNWCYWWWFPRFEKVLRTLENANSSKVQN